MERRHCRHLPSRARLAALSSQLRPCRQQPCSGAVATAGSPAAAAAAAGTAAADAERSSPSAAGLAACPATIYDPQQLAALDVERFRRDGFICLPGIMTEQCRALWSASLRRCQRIQDHMIEHTDWDGLDWPAHGLPRRDGGPVTAEQRCVVQDCNL